MRVRSLLAAATLATAGVVLPAAPASACIAVYLPVIGSTCNPCQGIRNETGLRCP